MTDRPGEHQETQTVPSPGAGFARVIWQRVKRDRLAMLGLYFVAAVLVISYLAPVLANNKPIVMRWEGRLYFPAVAELFPLKYVLRYNELRTLDFSEIKNDPSVTKLRPLIPFSAYETSLPEKLQPPSWRHWMGTDNLGRDITSRMIYGSRISLKVGFVAVGIALLIGLIAGSLAGYYGGLVDMLISRLIEVVMCFPVFFLILAVIAFLPPSIFNIMIIIGLTRWTSIARYSRGEFLRLKQQDFTYAARALGASDRKIIVRHILPNSIAPVLVAATFGVANAILIEAALSFLGFGAQPPTPSWGGILAMAREFVGVAWWLVTFPGLAIFLTVTAYNMVGDGLRDASDPRLTPTDRR